jgi:hypothetical protein
VNAPRAIFAIARADFLERVRRYSFLVTLFFAFCLGYWTATGRISLQLDEFRGVYTSAWIGTLVALVTSCFVSLTGFYIVKNSVDRDRSTGVGQILAATPLSRSAYAFGKFLSNFAVLTGMLAVLALCALAMQFVVAEDPRIDLWALLAPFLLLALPVLALTAAISLLFEMLPVLRGGLGNVIWFFAWTFSIALPILSGLPWLDPMGIFTVMESLSAAARLYIPGYHGGMAFQIDFGQIHVAQNLRWLGLTWTSHLILPRLMWFVAAVLLAFLAALVFDRFDATRAASSAVGNRKVTGTAGSAASLAADSSLVPPQPAVVRLTALSKNARGSGFHRIFAAELRLALQGLRWWWYAVAVGLLIAQLASPLAISRGPLLGVAWIWPLLVWSAMGSRESRFGTRSLLFTCANILPRQLLACFLAGLTVAILTGAGAGIRLLLANDLAGLFAWLAGALFLPALALGLGILSGTAKLFEGLLTAIWYVGPMNHIPGLDFTGAASGPHTISFALIYLALAATLLLSAFAIRSRQLRSV